MTLATLGMTKEYLGEELGSDKIYKLSQKGIEKYFNRYQLVQGKKVADVLRERGIRLGIRMISYFLPLLIQSEKLVQDLQKDELVNRELSNIIGLFVLKGGRLVALASGIIKVANHVSSATNVVATDQITLHRHSQDVDNTLATNCQNPSQDVDNSLKLLTTLLQTNYSLKTGCELLETCRKIAMKKL